MHLALLIHSDPNWRAGIRQFLESGLEVECVGVESRQDALAWLGGNSRPVDFVFEDWMLGSAEDGFSKALRARGKSILHLCLSSREDYGWATALFHTPGLLKALFASPVRVSTFVRLVKQKVAVDPLAKPCALLVEDDEIARAVVKQYLLSFGFSRVVESPNGANALAILEKDYRDFSLVVSDWAMPELSGIELLRSMRAKPWLSRIPFVMITAATAAERVKTLQAAELGVSGYLLKPFSSKTFHSQMDAILHEIGKQRQAEAYLITGRVLLALGDSFRAEEALQEGISLFPHESLIWEAVGDAQVLKGRESRNLAPAADAYERALKLNPANVLVVMKYFEVACSLGRMNDAVRVLRPHLHRSELEDTLRTRLGKVYLEAGDFGRARQEFQRALGNNPASGEAKSLLATAVERDPKRVTKFRRAG